MTSNERLDGLLAYLDGLTKLKYEGDYMCVKEMTECIGWIREEFTKDDVNTREPAVNRLYTDELKRIAHKYRQTPVNDELFQAMLGGLRVKTLWVDRGCGTSTSAVALTNVVSGALFVVESRQMVNYNRDNLGAKNVVYYGDLLRGSDLIRNNELIIFDDIKDRSKIVGALQACGDSRKRIIKIRSSDYTD